LESATLAVRAQIPQRVLQGAEIFSSPTSRCLVLARELAAPRSPVIAHALLEMNFGSWEGKLWEAIPRDQLDAWASDVWRYRPGGAESAAMVAERWNRWSREVQRSVAEIAVAVTHAGVIRVALACCGRLNAAQFAHEPIAFGSVHAIDIDAHPVRACAVP
jgi:alpha-ribazole phosphatase